MSRAPVDVAEPARPRSATTTRRCRAWSSRGGRALLFGVFVAVALAFLYFVLPKLTGLSGRLEAHQGRRPVVAGDRARAARASRSCGYVWLFRAVFVRGEQSRIDWRASYEITMAGPRGDAPVRGRGRRRRRADRLGAAALGDGAADGGLPDGRLPRAALRRLHGLARGRRHRPALRPLRRAAAPFAITVVPAIFARGADRCSSSAMAALPEDAERRLAAVGERLGARGAVRRQGGHGPGLRGQRRADRDRPRARARRRACSARSCGGTSTSLTLWACVPRLRARPAAVRGHRHGATSSGCSATRCRCPAGSAASTAGMIGAFAAFGVVGRLRDRRGADAIARSRSGCRRCRARSPTSSCAGRSAAGARTRPERARAPRGDRAGVTAARGGVLYKVK